MNGPTYRQIRAEIEACAAEVRAKLATHPPASPGRDGTAAAVPTPPSPGASS